MTDSFDVRAARWDENTERVERARRDADAIAQAVGRGGLRTMELGCGTGTTALALKNVWSEIVLCDSSAGMLTMAREKIQAAGLEGVSYFQSDLVEGPLPEGPFDLVYATMMLHHVKDPVALFRRLAPLFAPGGQLIVIDLDSEDGSFHAESIVPHNGFTREELERTVGAAGMTIHSWRPCASFRRAEREYTRFLMIAVPVVS